MDADRTSILTEFEKKEKKIQEFEEQYTKNEQLLVDLTNKCEDLEQKLQMVEASRDDYIATQLNELRSKIKELEEMSSRLRSALGQMQDENIKLEDELNSIKSEHGDINELKSKLKELEETVIAQQKEIVEKDKIIKGEFITGEGLESVSGQKFIVGKVETLKEFNRLIEDVSIRLFLVVPKIEDTKQLTIQVGANVDIRIATSFDLENKFHRQIIEKYPNAEFRNYGGRDRWGIERDAEEVCLIAESENKDYIGISSSDSKICELFSKLLTEAWLKGEKITL